MSGRHEVLVRLKTGIDREKFDFPADFDSATSVALDRIGPPNRLGAGSHLAIAAVKRSDIR
jgi:hypothetical protein